MLFVWIYTEIFSGFLFMSFNFVKDCYWQVISKQAPVFLTYMQLKNGIVGCFVYKQYLINPIVKHKD